VRRGIVQVQDLLKHFVNLAGHENANVPLLIRWRKQNDAAMKAEAMRTATTVRAPTSVFMIAP
jgi:hypothetical protein